MNTQRTSAEDIVVLKRLINLFTMRLNGFLSIGLNACIGNIGDNQSFAQWNCTELGAILSVINQILAHNNLAACHTTRMAVSEILKLLDDVTELLMNLKLERPPASRPAFDLVATGYEKIIMHVDELCTFLSIPLEFADSRGHEAEIQHMRRHIDAVYNMLLSKQEKVC